MFDSVEFQGQKGILLGSPGATRSYMSLLGPRGAYHEILASLADLKPLADPIPHTPDILAMLAGYCGGRTGTDPEIFMQGPKGSLIPAWEFLPPQADAMAKHIAALKVESLSPINSTKPVAYWDGFQAEFSFTGACHCHEILTGQVWSGLKAVLTAARTKHPQANLLAQDVVRVPASTLQEAPLEYVQLGCAPSANAYGIPPIEGIEGRLLPIRFSGCHLHFSKGTPYPIPPPKWFPEGTVVMMDKIGGLMLTALGRGLEDPERRKYYGRPGEYRLPKADPTSYRIEYRTPGSFLLRCPQAFIFAADVCRMGYRMGLWQDGRTWDEIPDVSQIIMECDADAAAKLIKKHWGLYSNLIDKHWRDAAVTSATAAALQKGIAPWIGKQTVENAWNLTNSLPNDYRWRHSVVQIAQA